MTSNPLSRLRARRSGGTRRERGATIVEFALVSVVLFTLVFGLIEGGLLIRASNAVSSSAADAIRRASVAGNADDADWQILQQLAGRGVLDAATINYVVIYDAASGSGAGHPDCLNGIEVANECNVYQRADFEQPRGAFGCSGGLGASWCPADREGDNQTIEFIGVHIDAEYNGLFGVLDAVTGDNGISIDARRVMPFEGNGFN